MPRGVKTPPGLVVEIKEAYKKFPMFTSSDLAKYCNTSEETARRAIRGEYDHLLEPADQSNDGISEVARAIDIASSDICDVLNHNRSVVSDFAGVASAEQMQLALVYINRQLFTIGHLLAAILDPETKTTKTMADHFRAEIKADTINGGKRK